jgi:hypothetical protein
MHVGSSFKMAIRHLLYFILVSLTLKMEVTSSSQVSAECQGTTWHYISEERALNFRYKQNSLK